jgi:hypothetical protein
LVEAVERKARSRLRKRASHRPLGGHEVRAGDTKLVTGRSGNAWLWA